MKTLSIIAAMLIGYTFGSLFPIKHHSHTYDRWSLVARSERAGPMYQTRTCVTCGWTDIHELGK